jgi:hypothetical protein
MAELLVLFKDAQDSRGPWPHHQSFRRASLRSPSSKTGDAAKGIPVLLTTELLLFCSPRDTPELIRELRELTRMAVR